MSTIPAHITAWSAYLKALDRGEIEDAERFHRQWRDLLSGSARTDATSTMTDQGEQKPAAAKGEADGGGIDWAKVAREANTMVELNKAANEAWQGRRKGVKGEDG